MRRRLRRFAEWAVYGFLDWFESFESVWQTTLMCVGVGVFEIGFPNVDRHLFAVLVVSLYATFTQNGLAHENKLNSRKLDRALEHIDHAIGKVDTTVAAVLQLAQNETHMQDAVAETIDSAVVALRDLRTHLTDSRKETP